MGFQFAAAGSSLSVAAQSFVFADADAERGKASKKATNAKLTTRRLSQKANRLTAQMIYRQAFRGTREGRVATLSFPPFPRFPKSFDVG